MPAPRFSKRNERDAHNDRESDEKADHLSVIVGENEKQLHELREERKLLQSSVDFEVAERIRFSKLHDEVVTSMQSQRRALASATDELDKARDRVCVMKLEPAVGLLGEREELQASLQTAETLRETDAKNYEIRLEALTSRARLAEHLLEKARDETAFELSATRRRRPKRSATCAPRVRG